jgi:phosphohistidine phosphatase
MALRLAELDLVPDHVLCSDSARTLETWDVLSAVWRDRFSVRPHVEVRADLYLASPRGIVAAARTSPPEATTLMVLAHNPGLHDVSQILSRPEDTRMYRRLARKFPTGAVAVLECDIGSWATLDRDDNQLRDFIRPKDLRR